jgi:RNA processing factor Prp31
MTLRDLYRRVTGYETRRALVAELEAKDREIAALIATLDQLEESAETTEEVNSELRERVAELEQAVEDPSDYWSRRACEELKRG